MCAGVVRPDGTQKEGEAQMAEQTAVANPAVGPRFESGRPHKQITTKWKSN